MNKRLYMQKLRAKVGRLNYKPPKRVKTKVPRRVREGILATKTKQAHKKRLRARPRPED